MKKLILFSILGMCLIYTESSAQFGYYNDALLFGRTSFGGSTRIQSLGGAQVSLGGDISSAGSNPAGLGFYNRSEFSFTPGLNFQSSKSTFNGDERTESFQNNFDIGNIGIVFNNQKGKDNPIKSTSFAITLNKINDFNEEISYSGYNDFSSILFSFQDDAGNLSPSALSELSYAALETNLLIPFEDNGVQFYDPVNLTTIDEENNLFYSYPKQEETITRSGSQYQWNFSGGANYNDKLYFGASLGFVTLRYEQVRNYTESEFYDLNADEFDPFLDFVSLRDELDITGNGVNGTFGIIVRPVKYLTVGVSYQTPTFYSLTEENTFTLTSSFFQSFDFFGASIPGGQTSYTPDGVFTSNYNLRTPGKLNVGSTVFVGKNGFISGDIEFVDYSSARLRSGDFSVNADNDEIATLYKSTINYRVGGEFRLDMFRFRGGYSIMQNPFDSDLKRANESITFGVGYRKKKHFFDIGVVNTSNKEFYSPYVTVDNLEPEIETKISDTKLIFTLGFNF